MSRSLIQENVFPVYAVALGFRLGTTIVIDARTCPSGVTKASRFHP